MQIVPVEKRYFVDWKRMRNSLYTGLSDDFNQVEMEEIVGAEDRDCFIAIAEGGEAIGFMEISLRNLVDGCLSRPVGYIEGIYLEPDRRGKGKGRQMLNFMVAWFRERGCKEMATDTEIENEAAQRFYKAMGFEETWRIVEFKKGLEE